MPEKRIGSLKRIARLYGAVEQMRSAALRQASAAVHEAEKAIGAERAFAVASHAAGRQALDAGDSEERMLAATQRQVAGLRIGRVERLRVARVAVKNAAMTEFLDSRVRTEQMKQVVETMVEQGVVEETRRSQAVSDDRYLARLRWSDGRGKKA